MHLRKALEIVHAMATSLFKRHGEFCKPAQCLAEAVTALNTVEDFVVNHFVENDTSASNTSGDRLSTLLDAMEHHGDAEGTEAQLGNAQAFLRLAFSLMTKEQQTAFLAHADVIEFIGRETDATCRCRVCGDPVAQSDFRAHLVSHNPNAQGMESEDVAAQFEQGAT